MKRRKNKAPFAREKLDKVVEEISAGGIVFRRRGKLIQFAVMKDSYGKWAFPKGRKESGETLEEAAARETLEEMGLEEIRLWGYLGKIEIWFRDRFENPGVLVHKHIHFFLFSTLPDAQLFPNTDPDAHVQDARWVPSARLSTFSSYPDMEPVVKRALEDVARIAK